MDPQHTRENNQSRELSSKRTRKPSLRAAQGGFFGPASERLGYEAEELGGVSGSKRGRSHILDSPYAEVRSTPGDQLASLIHCIDTLAHVYPTCWI